MARSGCRPGDYLVVCDRSGFVVPRSQARLTWDGLLVWEPFWLPRQPQDFVRAVPDDRTVPIMRPDVVINMGQTAVKVAAVRNATSIDLDSTTGIADRDGLAITMDNGILHTTFCNGTPVGDTVQLGSYLPFAAAIGNIVYLPHLNE